MSEQVTTEQGRDQSAASGLSVGLGRCFEKEKEAYAYHGKPQQWQIGFDRGFKEGAACAMKETPDLSAVIAWLENGCDPKEAAKELRIYQQRMRPNAV